MFNEVNDLRSEIMFLRDNSIVSNIKELDIKQKELIEDIVKLLNLKGTITFTKFEEMYAEELLKNKDYSTSFKDFLTDNLEYGIISTCCEFKEDYGILRCMFENEECTPEKVSELNLK